MTKQLVKKGRTDTRKRKGYKGLPWFLGGGATGTIGIDVLANPDPYMSLIRALMGGKDGGRVTKRGIGKAKRGFGRVMGKN